MADNRFRPTVYTLEGRDVPASGVSAPQVLAAIGFVEQTPGIVGYLQDNLNLAKLGGAGQSLLTAADTNRVAVNTLTGFIQDALANAVANPAAAEQLNALAGGAGVLIVQASANAAACDALAAQLGNPRVPPPPPPPTGAGNSNIGGDDQNPPGGTPVTSNLPSDGSAITKTVPDLNNAAFTAVGTAGLRVQDVVVGTGATATSSSKVTVRYRGFLASDGTQFDTNVDNADATRNVPLPATLGPAATDRTVIEGFAEGTVGMKVGGIRYIDIPGPLGYPNGSGTTIPPNARLVFAVQLLSVS